MAISAVTGIPRNVVVVTVRTPVSGSWRERDRFDRNDIATRRIDSGSGGNHVFDLRDVGGVESVR